MKMKLPAASQSGTSKSRQTCAALRQAAGYSGE